MALHTVWLLLRHFLNVFSVLGSTHRISLKLFVAMRLVALRWLLASTFFKVHTYLCILQNALCIYQNYWTDADMILRETQLQNPAILLPILGTLFHADVFIESGLLSYAEGKKLAVECPDLMKVLVKDAHRCFMRGVNGQVFEMLNAETTQTWQDPRTIVTKNIAVWYADDDSLVRPEYGSWLATYLKCEDRDLSVKSDKVGLGHFTWMVPPSCETAAMVRTLLANTS